jgi:hypothetical protein
MEIDSALTSLTIKWHYKKWYIEKWYQSEVFRHLRSLNYFCYHIADVWYDTKMLDWYIVSPTGVQSWIEFKKIDGYTFNLSQFEDSQRETLFRFDNRWVPYRIAIYSQKTNTHRIFNNISELVSAANDKGWIKIF